MNKQSTKKILIGIAIIAIPFSSIFVGSYLIYKELKKKKQTKTAKEEK